MERDFFYSEKGDRVLILSRIAEMGDTMNYIDRLQYKYDNLLVIGNGFDLNLGLHTTYRNFVESCIFKKMYVRRSQEKRAKGNPVPSLIDYLYGKKFIERWYDIEQALLEYVSQKPDGNFIYNISEDKEDYDIICQSLVEYLTSIFTSGDDLKQSRVMRETPAGKILKKMNHNNAIIYSFNYTPIYWIINSIYGDNSMTPVRIHGAINEETISRGDFNENSIILGIETNDIKSIASGYSFLIKSNNPAYRSTSISYDLVSSKNVIIFGHSLNQMDFGYFKEYFKTLTLNTDKKRKLVIITRDEQSRITILDNIRHMGISVRDIFSHISLDFILTQKLDNNDKSETERFKKLLEELGNN